MGPAGESAQETVNHTKELKKRILEVISLQRNCYYNLYKFITTRFRFSYILC